MYCKYYKVKRKNKGEIDTWKLVKENLVLGQ